MRSDQDRNYNTHLNQTKYKKPNAKAAAISPSPDAKMKACTQPRIPVIKRPMIASPGIADGFGDLFGCIVSGLNFLQNVELVHHYPRERKSNTG